MTLSRRLALFTRLPVSGEAKTRLIPPLTPDQAAALQRAMTGDLLERLAHECAPTTDLELRLAESASDARPLPLAVPPEWRTAPQGTGDLGARLRRAAHDAARHGVAGLALIGADAPLLPTGLIESAFAALDRADVALAPAEDGGYVLLALATNKADPTRFDVLFDAIPWGTDDVATATRTAAHAAGLTIHLLPTHWDVDRPPDLTRLAAAIGLPPPGARPRRTEVLLGSVGPVQVVHKPLKTGNRMS